MVEINKYEEDGVVYIWSEFFAQYMPEDQAYSAESMYSWAREA